MEIRQAMDLSYSGRGAPRLIPPFRMRDLRWTHENLVTEVQNTGGQRRTTEDRLLLNETTYCHIHTPFMLVKILQTGGYILLATTLHKEGEG